MLEFIKNENILFINIETVPVVASFFELPEGLKYFWEEKSELMKKNSELPSETFVKAGNFAEFGKIVCISVGFIVYKKGTKVFRIKSFYGDDEKKLLSDFAYLLNNHFNAEENYLCAHNGKEFDFPYLCRRLLVNGLHLPKQLDIAGKKPWDVKHVDTLELWKFGDYRNNASIDLLATIFQIPIIKEHHTTEDIARLYWEEKNLPQIVNFCQKDVLSAAQLFLRYKGETLIRPELVVVVGDKE